MAAMNAATVARGDGLMGAQQYRDQLAAVKKYRDGVAGLSAGFNEVLQASGQYNVETVKTISRTESITKAITEQKFALRDLRKSWSSMGDVIREQQSLQRASIMQWSGSKTGKGNVDIYMPTDLDHNLNDARVKYGMINQMIGSIAHQTVNWGKNTQWAGRQITVGIGVPVAIAAAAMGKMAYEADRQLTRLAKVYDTQSQAGLSADQAAINKANELRQVRANAMVDARNMAQQYGASIADTIKLEADLAAIGRKGMDLRKSVSEVTRIATLGEIEHQTALDMTIALMSAWNMKAEDLTDTFNYMNAIENATSLQTKDFAEAIPRVASSLANLGVSVQQTGVLMTAMAEGGVNAAEGANALKSATARLLGPTAKAQEMFKGYGISITEIVDRTKGDLFDTLTELSARMRGLDDLTKMRLTEELFGTYQLNRLNVVLNGLGDVMNGVSSEFSQTSKAFEIMNQSTEEWGRTADQEIRAFQQSVSGRFKRAVETIKVEMAELGEPILKVAAWLVETGGKILSFINSLPDSIKTIGMAILAGAAIAGPLIMLLGLMANLTGNIFKFASSLGALTIGFKALTPQEKAQELMARRAASAFNAEASAVSQLTIEMKRLEAAMTGLLDNQLRAAGLTAMPGLGQGKPLITPGKYGSNDMVLLSDHSRQMAENAERTKRSFGQTVGMMGGLAIGALAFKNMFDSSNGILENMINIALVASSINMSGLGGVLKNVFSSSGGGIKGFFSKISAGFDKMGGAGARMWGKATAGANGFGGIVKALTGPLGRIFGAAGLIAGGVAFIAQYIAKMNELEDRQKAINESTKTWADILGYVEQINTITTNGDVVSAHNENLKMVDQLREGNEDLAKALDEAGQKADNFRTVYSLAMREALKVRLSGGSADQAKQAFNVALLTAGLNQWEAEKLTVRFESVDLDNPDAIREQLRQQLQQIADGLADEERLHPSGFIGIFQRGFGGDLTDEARSMGAEMARLFATGFASAETPQIKNEMFMDFREQVNTAFGSAFDGIYSDNKVLMDKLGIDTAEELGATLSRIREKLRKSGITELTDTEKLFVGNDGNLRGEFKQFEESYTEMLEVILRALGEAMHMSSDQIDRWIAKHMQLADVQKDLGAGTMSVAQAQKSYGDSIARGASSWGRYNDAQKLAVLNGWRAKAGLQAATHWTQGFGDAAEGAAGAVDDLAGAMAGVAITGDQYVNAMKTAMSSTMDTAYNLASSAMDRVHAAQVDSINAGSDARLKALENRGRNEDRYFDGQEDALEARLKAEQKAFDKAWDRREDALDDRIEAVRDKADAELEVLEAADDTRNELFEREKSRISRLAQLYNSNVDFNAALNSGDMDEAAKIYSSTASQVQQWGMEDQQSALDKISSQRRKQIELDRDARVEALEAEKEKLSELRDYETELFDERQERSKKELETRRENAREALRAAEEAERAKTQATIRSTQLRQQYDRQKLEIELATLKAFIPQNEAQLWGHIAKVEAAYQTYGINLKGQGEWWGKLVGTALHNNVDAAAVGLQNDINWAQIAADIASKIEAGTGIDFDQVKQFLATGKWPSGQAPAATPYSGTQKTAGNRPSPYVAPGRNRQGGFQVYHEGGNVGFTGGKPSQKARMGVPASASFYPSEVPTLLKAGEYVINTNAAKRHRALLDSINSGRLPQERVPPMAVRHMGGPLDAIASSVAMYGVMMAKLQEIIGTQMVGGMGQTFPGGNLGGGGGIGDGMFQTKKTGWPARRYWSLSPNVAGAVDFAKKQWGSKLNGIGTVGARSITSDHPWGKAADFMVTRPGQYHYKSPGGIALGNQVADWFIKNPNAFGTKYVIWRDRITEGNGWKRYGHPSGAGGDTLQHRDHPHVSFYHKGGMAEKLGANLPQLRTGGGIKVDNTLANLHKGETVLTAPLTNAMKDLLVNGTNVEYNVTVDLRGAAVREDVDIEQAVYKAIDKLKSKVGRNRVIS